jgi:hypothetical protein
LPPLPGKLGRTAGFLARMMRSSRIHIAISILWITMSGQGICRMVQCTATASDMKASFPSSQLRQDSVPKEAYVLMTDRSIYISGEKIRFRIYNQSSEAVRSLPPGRRWQEKKSL